MAIDRVKQLEIFSAFVLDFQKMKNIVSQMVISSNDQDIKRVEMMCGYISDMIHNSHNSEDLLTKIDAVEANEKLQKLLDVIKAIISKEQNLFYVRVVENFKQLDQLIEFNHLKRDVNEIFNEDVITTDSKVPISEDNLNFLNWIAKLSVENKKEMEEADRIFKRLEIRDKIRYLYYRNSFYFEQVFSNADVDIQRKILVMVRDYHDVIEVTDEQKEALENLEDISILSDINALAIKSKSNVSDHQAFDAFCKILKKNTNKKLINKILRENLIMSSMYRTNSSTLGEHYALRKMFVSARYPYNKVILQRYMQLLEKNEAEMALIFKILKKDFEFNKTYERYVKSEETSEFKKLALKLVQQAGDDDLSDGLLESLAFIVESFIMMEKHDSDILTQSDVFIMLEQIYFYVIRNRLFQKNIPLIQMLENYRHARIESDLKDKRNPYFIDDKTVIYGVSPSDIWYDINRFLLTYKMNYIKKVYLKYDEITYYVFDVGSPFSFMGKNHQRPNFDKLPAGEVVIVCADVDKTNFEIYAFGLYGRIARAFLADRIEVQSPSVVASLFKKKMTPGIEKENELRFRKIYSGILTFLVMSFMTPQEFAGIYLKKIKPILDELLACKITQEEIDEFITFIDLDIRPLDISNKSVIGGLITHLNTLSYESSTEEILDHSKKFLETFNYFYKMEV